jgi:CBS domain-containing protein
MTSTVSSSQAVPTSGKPFAAFGLVRDFNFNDVKLGALVASKHNMIRALTTTTLDEAMDLMRNNNISALPIFDITKKRYVGFLTFFDIMAFVAFGSFKKALLKSDLENLKFGTMLAGDILNISNEAQFIWNFDSDDSLEAALEPFVKGVHRILVNKRKKALEPNSSFGATAAGKNETTVEEEKLRASEGVVGPPTHEVKHRILSQIDVVTFLYRWANDRGLAMLNRSLDELQLVSLNRGIKPVVVSEQTPAIDAFQQMYHAGVNAVAIVDSEGKICANLSTTDVRYLTQQNLAAIFLPVLLFLNQIHGQKAAKPIIAYPESRFDDLLLKVVTARVKRVWVVDSRLTPLGVVTLTDIIAKFAPQDTTLIRPSAEGAARR